MMRTSESAPSMSSCAVASRNSSSTTESSTFGASSTVASCSCSDSSVSYLYLTFGSRMNGFGTLSTASMRPLSFSSPRKHTKFGSHLPRDHHVLVMGFHCSRPCDDPFLHALPTSTSCQIPDIISFVQSFARQFSVAYSRICQIS